MGPNKNLGSFSCVIITLNTPTTILSNHKKKNCTYTDTLCSFLGAKYGPLWWGCNKRSRQPPLSVCPCTCFRNSSSMRSRKEVQEGKTLKHVGWQKICKPPKVHHSFREFYRQLANWYLSYLIIFFFSIMLSLLIPGLSRTPTNNTNDYLHY